MASIQFSWVNLGGALDTKRFAYGCDWDIEARDRSTH